jgi:hypothetical protein
VQKDFHSGDSEESKRPLLGGHDDWFSHAAALRASSIKYSEINRLISRYKSRACAQLFVSPSTRRLAYYSVGALPPFCGEISNRIGIIADS